MRISPRQDLSWNAAPHPLPAAAFVSRPKPDIAVGVRETEPARCDIRTAPVWSTAYLGALRKQSGLLLIPHVAQGECPLIDRLLLI